MKQQHLNTILEKIKLLNQATTDSMLGENNIAIVKNFTEAAIEILGANFGFVWWKSTDNYKIVYRSMNTPSDIMSPSKNDHIIPIHYGDHVYGNIVLGYNKKPHFTEEEKASSELIGNIVAQAVTIPWLMENEHKALVIAEKQKEIQVLLDQEKTRTEFISNTTHEFRTPLAIMQGQIDLALMDKGNLKKAISALKTINMEIKYLASMIADLVLITSQKNVDKELRMGVVDVAAMLRNTMKRLATIASKKNVALKIEISKPKLLTLGDDIHLERLFLNLIENAINYSKEKKGEIKITADEKKGNIIITIADNGIGITREDLPNIFERFYRGDKAHSSYGKHSGLGLALSKWITEIHGGHINVKSTSGVGSTFTISLPKVTIQSKKLK